MGPLLAHDLKGGVAVPGDGHLPALSGEVSLDDLDDGLLIVHHEDTECGRLGIHLSSVAEKHKMGVARTMDLGAPRWHATGVIPLA